LADKEIIKKIPFTMEKRQKKKKKQKKKPRYKLNQGGDLYNENDKTLKKISEYGKTSHVHELEELIL
jgi:hypothetical protein